jgi:hypothetical protein
MSSGTWWQRLTGTGSDGSSLTDRVSAAASQAGAGGSSTSSAPISGAHPESATYYHVKPYAQQGGYSGIPSSVGTSGATANTIGALQNAFINNPATQQQVMAAASIWYGYPVKNMSYGTGLLNQFSEIYAANPTGPGPWQMIRGLLNGTITNPDGSGPGGGPGGGGGGGGGGSSTTMQIRLTDPESAKQLINTAMASLLGREATSEEYKKFLTTLNSEERSNPIVTTVEGDTVTTTGGTNPNQIAEDYATSREDFAEFQAATTYMDAFIAALEDPVNI